MADIINLKNRGIVSPKAAQNFNTRMGDVPPLRDSAATTYLKRRKNENYDDWSARHDAFGKASYPFLQAHAQAIGKPPEEWTAGDIFRFQDSPEVRELIKQMQ